MEFTQDNKVIQLCTKGMELEGEGKPAEAIEFFDQAWRMAKTDFEKLTAAHYVARHKKDIASKLAWDKIALHHALRIDDDNVKAALPSLYLNIGKCHEDLAQFEHAKSNYLSALAFSDFLPGNGYGNMVRSGINKGLERVNDH